LKDTLAGVLPFWGVLLGIGKLVDISNDLAKGGGDKFVRQIDWLCKLCIP
jgi:hypothetical protein